VDTFVTFFVSGLIYFAARIYKKGGILNYILAGAFYGMALASKTAAIPFALAVIAAHLFRFFSITGTNKSAKSKRLELWVYLGWASLAAFIVFFICMPHALLDFQKFTQDQNEQKRILVTGEADVPYNRQYINTTPYLFYIKNLVLFSVSSVRSALKLFGVIKSQCWGRAWSPPRSARRTQPVTSRNPCRSRMNSYRL